MSFYSPWLKRRPRSGAKSKTRSKLQLELLEDRRLPTSGLGQISGLTDTPQELFVTGLYYDVLYRVPNPSDVASWVNVLNAGTTPTAIALAFTGSTESHDNFILDNYNNYLGRDATAGDIGAWASAMQGGMSEEAVSATFLPTASTSA